MSRNNWSFRFHNSVLKHSNASSLFNMQEWNPTPGNIEHMLYCELGRIHRTEQQWIALFKYAAALEGLRGEKFKRFWWRTHAREIYWK